MLKKKLQDEIVVKTKAGDFKVLKNGQLEDVPSAEIIVPEDDLLVINKDSSQEVLNNSINKSSTTLLPKQVELNKKPTANFYMDVSDEHDAEQFKEKDYDKKNRAIKEYIEAKAIEIISHTGLGEAATKNQQLKNIVISRIRDVRSLAETKEALARLEEINNAQGGNDWINTLIPLVEKDRDKIAEMVRTGNIPKIKEQKVGETPENNIKNNQAVSQILDVKYKKNPEIIDGHELSKSVVMGPVDEIRSMTLADFRKLADNPNQAADKVLQKISLLEDESLVKRSQGVVAWHKSEIYKLYLKIGATSMAEKKPIEQVIRELQENNQPYLAPEEFNVVADLNRKLSY